MNFQKQVDQITDLAIEEFHKAPIKRRTKEDRLSAVGNIYFLFVEGELVYIGQRQAVGMKTRLNNHLFGSSYQVDENNVQNGTVSKWHLVQAALNKGQEITFKTILIQPDSLRTTIELELISRLCPEWNIQGK